MTNMVGLKTRTTAFENLRLYLRAHTHFTALDLLKLWKGLFYCMWMLDRPKAQQRLAVDLAGLVDVLRDENAMGFLRAFWETMAREWNGIDVLRYALSVTGLISGGWEDAIIWENGWVDE